MKESPLGADLFLWTDRRTERHDTALFCAILRKSQKMYIYI